RAARAFWLREQAAREDLAAAAMPERDNGDEERYADRIGSFSKGLPHNALGEVDHEAYRALQRGLESVRESALERVPLGGTQKLVNPLAGVAFDLEGIDIQKLAVPSALALASAERAREMIELYWMALCRDVPFSGYTDAPIARAAAAEMGVGPDRLFRGFTEGDKVGPYVSQLFLTPFAYGQYLLDGRITTFASGV